jgi:hypothetical protein
MAEHFDDTDDRKILGANHRLDAGLAEVRAGASEEIAVRPAAAEFLDQFGRVVVAGSFSGGNQDGARRGRQSSE